MFKPLYTRGFDSPTLSMTTFCCLVPLFLLTVTSVRVPFDLHGFVFSSSSSGRVRVRVRFRVRVRVRVTIGATKGEGEGEGEG